MRHHPDPLDCSCPEHLNPSDPGWSPCALCGSLVEDGGDDPCPVCGAWSCPECYAPMPATATAHAGCAEVAP